MKLKNLLFICVLQLGCGTVFSQTQDSVKKVIIIEERKVRSEKPQFPGGQNALSEFLLKNVKYPKEARKNKIEGACLLTFTVTSFGNILDVKVARGVPNCPECDEEAIRVVKSMPQWIPAGSVDNRSDCVQILSITFKR